MISIGITLLLFFFPITASSFVVVPSATHLTNGKYLRALHPQRVLPQCVRSIRRHEGLKMAQVSEKEAQVGIDKVVNALRKDRTAISELGRLEKVTNILGYGSPRAGVLAVRFNASFKKGGMGRSAVPLPFGLGQSNQSEGRGQMVGQVKASLNSDNGKILDCSVFRDLGYGRAFNLKV
mmetsp:Transcript_26972/g.55222  ORF Transcript_26972/g.55222 Transcript_26972/m.55222 type:complete len:179 (-) Transcript_26972:90-626(-)